MTAIINISLKNGVLDSQGKAVHHALDSLHFNNVEDVRVGRQVVMKLNAEDEASAKAQVTEMCEELLANTVIEDYEIEIIA